MRREEIQPLVGFALALRPHLWLLWEGLYKRALTCRLGAWEDLEICVDFLRIFTRAGLALALAASVVRSSRLGLESRGAFPLAAQPVQIMASEAWPASSGAAAGSHVGVQLGSTQSAHEW